MGPSIAAMNSLSPDVYSLTPAQRRTLLLAAVLMESGEDAVPAGDDRDTEGELSVAHAMARRLTAALDDEPGGLRVAAEALRRAAVAGAA
jgi:hypothetical protein